MNNLKNALSEQEMEDLSNLLDTLDEQHSCISLETFDGIATALAVMTRTVSFQEVAPLFFEADELPPKHANGLKAVNPLKHLTQEQIHYLDTALTRRKHHIERLLSNMTINDLNNPMAFSPWVMSYDADNEADKATLSALLGSEWAIGFVAVVEYFENDWHSDEGLLDDEVNPMLAPIYALALEASDWTDEMKAELDVNNTLDIETQRGEWLVQSIWACYELWEYWRYHAPKPKTMPFIKPITHGLGRNDPCHCGSEKKFKVCHGREID